MLVGSNHMYGVDYYYYEVVSQTEKTITLQEYANCGTYAIGGTSGHTWKTDEKKGKPFRRTIKTFNDGTRYISGAHRDLVFVDEQHEDTEIFGVDRE